MSNSGNYKETQDVWSFQTDLFQKAPDQKSSNKARVLSDTSVLLKCWFYKQAPQKVLIELSPGVSGELLYKTTPVLIFKNLKVE